MRPLSLSESFSLIDDTLNRTCRVQIRRDRSDRWSCNIFVSCVNLHILFKFNQKRTKLLAMMHLYSFIADENRKDLHVFSVKNSFARKFCRVNFLTNFKSENVYYLDTGIRKDLSTRYSITTVFAGIFRVVGRSFWYFKFFSAARLPEESAKGTIQY